MIRFKLLPGILISLSLFLISQENQTNADDSYRQLLQIREEISQLQRELDNSASNLQTHLKSLGNLDQQTTLQQKALRILQKEIEKNKSEISSLDVQINKLSKQLSTLENIFHQQILFTYKYQKGKELEWLLGSQNFNQALLRYRYFQTISESAQRSYHRLVEKQNELQTLQGKRTRELAQQQKLAQEKEDEQRGLGLKRGERQNLITTITRNKALLEAALREKKKSYEELESLIGSLESQRGERVLPPREQIQWDKISGDFAQQKKKT